MPDEELIDVIEDNARGPKRVQGDMGSAEQHSIPDLIELDKYKASKAASATRGAGVLRYIQLVPPGAHDVD